MADPQNVYDERELLKHLQLRYLSERATDGTYLGKPFRYPEQISTLQLDISDRGKPSYFNFNTGGMPEPPPRLDPSITGLSDDIMENIANTQRAMDSNPKPRGIIFPKRFFVGDNMVTMAPHYDPVSWEHKATSLQKHLNLTRQSLSQLDRNQIHGYGDFNWEAEKPPLQKQLFSLEKAHQYATEHLSKLTAASDRQNQIRDLRQAHPHIDLLAEEVESRAAKAWSMLERPTSSGVKVNMEPLDLVNANTPEGNAFKSYLVKAKSSLAALDAELGKFGLNSREFMGKNGYVLGVAGNLTTISDAHRLMTGGGIGVGPDGLPMIQSKSEMQESAGIPEELRNSFRVATDDEMANYRREAEKRDAEAKRFEELGKSLLAKQERKKTNDAIDAGAGMLNKMSGSKDWSSILGL